jgi:predicted nucleotidyltransferase
MYNNEMNDVIISKLEDLEVNQNVRVLYAVESGSRAWGFASPDSDYDVRFIYVRPLDEYLRLDEPRDVIEYELNDVFDISGWDIRKALTLIHKSNPSLFEWINSPIVYLTTEIFEENRDILNSYFQKKHMLYHYGSMAKRNFLENFKNDHVNLKKYFYVIRPILAFKWIDTIGTSPPVLFSELVKCQLEAELLSEMEKLISLKVSSGEGESQARILIWDKWIQENLFTIEATLLATAKDEKQEINLLNDFFLEVVHGYR